jgi:hypothetical protein
MRRIARLLALLIALVSSFLSLPALAQDAAGGAGRSTPSPFPTNLEDALERVAWDAARQGPLLVVDPLVPDPLVVRKAVAGKWGGVRFVEGGETRLSASARSGVCLPSG